MPKNLSEASLNRFIDAMKYSPFFSSYLFAPFLFQMVRAPVSKKGLPRRALMKPSYVSPSVAGSSKIYSTDDSSKVSEVNYDISRLD